MASIDPICDVGFTCQYALRVIMRQQTGTSLPTDATHLAVRAPYGKGNATIHPEIFREIHNYFDGIPKFSRRYSRNSRLT